MTTVRTILLLLATLGLAVASCSDQPGSSTTASPTPVASPATGPGIRGQATAGPVCPVEKNPPDPSCAPRPVSGAVVVVRSPAGAEVARATTGTDGTFVVAVPPGQYVVEGLPAAGLMGTPGPQNVTVTSSVPATIELSYDTGIR
jgi:hypothetical protein